MNNTGAAECFDCPERYYCDGTDPEGFVECTLGHYCETGTDVPINCPAGERETPCVSNQDVPDRIPPTLPRSRSLTSKTRRRTLDVGFETKLGLANTILTCIPQVRRTTHS